MKITIALIAVVAYITKTSAYCFSENLYYQQYPCCSDKRSPVYFVNKYGSWGVENNDWCGIKGFIHQCNDKVGYNGYPCCKITHDIVNTEVIDDEHIITYGYENGNWCVTPKDDPYIHYGNPFAGHEFYINQEYVELVDNAISSMKNKTLIAQAKKMKNYPTAVWIDSIADVENKLEKHLKAAKDISRQYSYDDTNNEETVLSVFVLNNLPGRNCHLFLKDDGKTYDGEFGINNQDFDSYKKDYIDAIENILKKYYKQPVVLIIEPNSITNLVKNSDRSRCKKANQYYIDGHKYLIQKLGVLPNVSLYLDIGNAYWFKTDEEREELAKKLKKIIGESTPGKVRGFASNVAKYAKWDDESDYLKAMHGALSQVGIESVYFVEDSSRNGHKTYVDSIYMSCNQKYAGVGFRPEANPDPDMDYLDAFFWIKPHGFSEQKKGENYLGSDFSRCKYNAPKYGEWFQEHFEEGLIYSNPPL